MGLQILIVQIYDVFYKWVYLIKYHHSLEIL